MKRITMNKFMGHAFCFCVLFLAGVIGSIVERPLNVATSVGGQIIFNCSSNVNGAIGWAYTTDCNTAAAQALTDNNCVIYSNYTSHYRTETPDGLVCNLIVSNVVMSLGGCYQCADGATAGRINFALLIVVDSNATFTTNTTDLIPGEYTTISNSMSYGGPSLQPPLLPPLFYWTMESDPNHNITSYTGSATTNSTSSSIAVEAPKTGVPPYVCNLFFNTPIGVPQFCASNTPTYGNSWITPIYQVSYAPENLAISGILNTCIHEPTEVICSASGYPPPTFKWLNLSSGNVLSQNSTVTIGSAGSYQCFASNTFRNVQHNASQVLDVADCKSPQDVNITALHGPCDDSCGELNSDTLTCKASGFPEPEYEWSFSGDKVIGHTVVAKKNIAYTCTATNHYADQPHSADSTLQVYWLNVLICVKLGISDPVCICLLVLVIYFGLNLLFSGIFITCYGCSESGRETLNDRFPWLRKMLPCMNDEGCKCFVWILYFVLLSIFAALVFFPTILIMASCCKKKKKSSQGIGNTQPSGRNGRGAGSTPLNTLGATPTYQHPARMSVTPNPPSSLNSSDHFQQDPINRPYPHSSNQQRQPEYWGNSGPYPQNPRNPRPPPRPSPSPLSTGGIIYAELGVDNQPQSRRPIQPIQDGSNTYADIALA